MRARASPLATDGDRYAIEEGLTLRRSTFAYAAQIADDSHTLLEHLCTFGSAIEGVPAVSRAIGGRMVRNMATISICLHMRGVAQPDNSAERREQHIRGGVAALQRATELHPEATMRYQELQKASSYASTFAETSNDRDVHIIAASIHERAHEESVGRQVLEQGCNELKGWAKHKEAAEYHAWQAANLAVPARVGQ